MASVSYTHLDVYKRQVISTVFAIVISGGSYFLGGFGRLFDGPSVYNAAGGVAYDSVIPAMLSGLPDLLIGIVVMLVLSASMSTLSSLVLTSSSTLALDFIKGNLIKNMKDKTQDVYKRQIPSPCRFGKQR